MQAIITQYHGATNFKPSKMSAKCERGSIRVSYDHALDIDENHRAACDALCAKFTAEDQKNYGTKKERSWSRPKCGGVIPDGRHVFTFIPQRVADRDEVLSALRKLEAAASKMPQPATHDGLNLADALAGARKILNAQ